MPVLQEAEHVETNNDSQTFYGQVKTAILSRVNPFSVMPPLVRQPGYEETRPAVHNQFDPLCRWTD